MVIGAITTNVAIFKGDSSVMLTSYVPMHGGAALLSRPDPVRGGRADRLLVFFGTLVVAKNEKTYEGSVPLVTFGAMTAAIIAMFTICLGRDHPDPDLPLVGRPRQGNQSADVPHHLVGLRPLLAADQRRGARLDLVR